MGREIPAGIGELCHFFPPALCPPRDIASRNGILLEDFLVSMVAIKLHIGLQLVRGRAEKGRSGIIWNFIKRLAGR